MEQIKEGRIIKGVGGFYTVICEDGREHICKARGLFRKNGETPLVGDRVRFSLNSREEGYLLELLPRENELLRPTVANVDTLLILVSASEPEPDLELVDKLLLYCKAQKIEPVLVINKCDSGPCAKSEAIKEQYGKAGISVYTVSAGSGFGLDALEKSLSGKTACLAGQSAVGKSSLLNKLFGLGLKTGELSAKTERGRHTTRHAELLRLPSGGFAVDTPGFSMLESVPFEPSEIPGAYPEYADHSNECRFPGCMHISEPDCCVKRMVEEGTISKERYSRYVKIVKETIESRRHQYD